MGTFFGDIGRDFVENGKDILKFVPTLVNSVGKGFGVDVGLKETQGRTIEEQFHVPPSLVAATKQAQDAINLSNYVSSPQGQQDLANQKAKSQLMGFGGIALVVLILIFANKKNHPHGF